jgi:hypothetical protein
MRSSSLSTIAKHVPEVGCDHLHDPAQLPVCVALVEHHVRRCPAGMPASNTITTTGCAHSGGCGNQLMPISMLVLWPSQHLTPACAGHFRAGRSNECQFEARRGRGGNGGRGVHVGGPIEGEGVLNCAGLSIRATVQDVCVIATAVDAVRYVDRMRLSRHDLRTPWDPFSISQTLRYRLEDVRHPCYEAPPLRLCHQPCNQQECGFAGDSQR